MNDVCLYIKVENEYNNYLYKMFKGIDFEDYYWKVLYSDVFCNDYKQEVLLQKDILESQEIKNVLRYDNYYIIELDVQCYKNGAVYRSIETVDDFMKSECTFLLLAYDCSFIHLYFKDIKMMDVVYNNCVEMGVEVKRKKENEINENILSSLKFS